MAYSTLQGGTSQLNCMWALQNSGGYIVLGSATVSDGAKSALIAALRDSLYTEVSVSGAEVAFSRGSSQDHPYIADIAFTGDVLITVAYTVGSSHVAQAVAAVNGA